MYHYITLTSPIRRYVDLYNQKCLIQILENKEIQESKNEEKLNHLNFRAKESKRHDRDLFFLNLLKNNTLKEISGVIIYKTDDKIQIYIEEWKRIINIKDKSYNVNLEDVVKLRYYFNPKEKLWKNRIIFEIF